MWKTKIRFVTAALLAALGAHHAHAQDAFPSKAITIVVPFAAGGSTDVQTRAVAEKMSEILGQSVIVENRAGGAGQVAASNVLQSKPDGYRLYLANVDTHAVNNALYKNLSYNAIRDFEPVMAMWESQMVLAVPADSPFKTVGDLVAAARAQPKRITFGSQGPGSSGHLLGEMLKSSQKLDMVHIPYKGVVGALSDLTAGQLNMMFIGSSSATQSAGKIRVLAIAGTQRVARLPDVPTLAEAGVQAVELTAWFGLTAPAGTPKPVIDKLNEALKKAINDPTIVARMNTAGTRIIASTPEQFKTLIAHDTQRIGKLIADASIKVE
jgi:tripartite-type tricarboxylate transporter receptor subunit TctC